MASQQLSIPSRPVPPILSRPVPSTSVCSDCCSLGRRCPHACPSSLPLHGLHIWARGRMIHLQTEISKTTELCRLCQHQLLLPPSTGISVRLLIDSIHATSSLFCPLGGMENVRRANVSKVIEFIISRTRRRTGGCGCRAGASVGAEAGSGSVH